MPEQKDLEHRVQLLRGGSVRVSVVEADGTPVKDVNVERRSLAAGRGNGSAKTTRMAWRSSSAWLPVRTRFRIGGRARGMGAQGGDFVRAGRRALAPATRSGRQAPEAGWETVLVGDGATAVTLKLTKSPSATLSGVVRENGTPLVGATVVFQQGVGDAGAAGGMGKAQMAEMLGGMRGGRGASVRTDDDGRYELKDLSAGEHRLRITHRERVMPAVVRIALRSGENSFDVELDTTVLRGTVTGPDGRPVAGATGGRRYG